jgi:UPF0755 protein
MKKLLVYLFLIGVLGSLLCGLYLNRVLFKPLPYHTPFVFELEKGTSAQELAIELTKRNLVPHPFLARLAMRFYGFDTHLKAGEYAFDPQMSLKSILEKLTSGKVVMHRLTLAEGLTSAQMLNLIDTNDFLSGSITETADEGELFPETYTFAKGESKNNIIKKAKKQMHKTLHTVWQQKDPNIPLKNTKELLILASLIEKETGINAERTKVASVFYNRLKINMLLQTDPTVIYALTMGHSDLGRALTRKDLKFDSPYNTYLYPGLPPSPICNPGLKALTAAAHPEDTPYFYFVADGKGGHRFAKTLAEHNQNIKLWLNN